MPLRSHRRAPGLLVLGLFASLVGCGSPGTAQFEALSTGMSEEEVRGLLGDPTVVVPAPFDEDGVAIGGPRWQYGDTLSTMTTAAAFPDTIPDRVWVVWFDHEGRVMTWRSPIEEGVDPDASGISKETPLFVDPAPARNR